MDPHAYSGLISWFLGIMCLFIYIYAQFIAVLGYSTFPLSMHIFVLFLTIVYTGLMLIPYEIMEADGILKEKCGMARAKTP